MECSQSSRQSPPAHDCHRATPASPPAPRQAAGRVASKRASAGYARRGVRGGTRLEARAGLAALVLPPDETVAGFDLRFVAGVDVLVFYCPGHDAQHLRACVDELRRCRARLVVPVALPSVECEA